MPASACDIAAASDGVAANGFSTNTGSLRRAAADTNARWRGASL